MPLAVTSIPVRSKPASSPRWKPLSLTLVTTVSPSATCSSMAKAVLVQLSRISATVRLKSSRVGPCPGIRLRSTKSWLSSSSMTSRLPLTSSSKKRRTRALFSSAEDTADFSSLPTCVLRMGRRHPMMPAEGVWRIDRSNLIHRSAWKGNSRKSTCRLLHSPGLTFLSPDRRGLLFSYVSPTNPQRRVYIRRYGQGLREVACYSIDLLVESSFMRLEVPVLDRLNAFSHI